MGAPILIVMENLLPIVAAGDNINQRPQVFYSWFSSHGLFLARPHLILNNQA
jgi:hypothetical protein